jgi:hypothetical protein
MVLPTYLLSKFAKTLTTFLLKYRPEVLAASRQPPVALGA